MASLHSIPRFLLPRGGPLLLRPRAFPVPILPLTALRYASKSPLPPRPKTLREQFKDTPNVIPRDAPRVIPQPDKYRPPSHGRRTPRSETEMKTYGPPISAEERERMRKKKYPNMMAPEGTFSHWFIHNKFIHLWITMGILLTLGACAFYMDFMHKCIYKEMLPTKKEWTRHPWASFRSFVDIYKMHMEDQSRIAEAVQLRKYEDVEKRKQFRLARIREAEERGEEYVDDPRYYVDEMGVRRRRVKRWLGIWE